MASIDNRITALKATSSQQTLAIADQAARLAQVEAFISKTPSVSVTALGSKSEGAKGTVTTWTVTLTLNRYAYKGPVSYNWGVVGKGSNPADANDFGGILPSGSDMFLISESVKTVTFTSVGDNDYEFDENFTLNIAPFIPLQTLSIDGVILNDDVQVIAPQKVAKIGMNIAPQRYYQLSRQHTNLAVGTDWRKNYDTDDGARASDKRGNLVTMAAGQWYRKIMIRPGKEARKLCIKWTPTGDETVAEVAPRQESGGHPATIDQLTKISNGLYTVMWTPDPAYPDEVAQVNLAFVSASGNGKVMDLLVTECNDAGVPLSNEWWLPSFVDDVSKLVRLRNLDYSRANGTTFMYSAEPITWADRTPAGSLGASTFWEKPKLVLGGITFSEPDYAGDGAWGGDGVLINGMGSRSMAHAYGARGNNFSVAINAPSGSGSVTWAGTYPDRVVITITPPSTAVTEMDVANFFQNNPTANWALRAKTTSTAAPQVFAAQPLTGGTFPLNRDGWSVEDHILLCNKAGIDAHICVSLMVSDDYVKGLCDFARDNLRSDLKLILEPGNEVWNFGTYYSHGWQVCRAIGLLYPSDTGTDLRRPADNLYAFEYGYAWICKRIFAVAKASFASNPSRLVRSTAGFQQVADAASKSTFMFDTLGMKDCTDEGSVALYEYSQLGDSTDASKDGSSQGQWIAGRAYKLFQYFTDFTTQKCYFTLVPHTSTTIAADLSAGNIAEAKGQALMYPALRGQELAINHAVEWGNEWSKRTNDRGNVLNTSFYEGGATGFDVIYRESFGVSSMTISGTDFILTVDSTAAANIGGKPVVGDKIYSNRSNVTGFGGEMLVKAVSVSGNNWLITVASTAAPTTIPASLGVAYGIKSHTDLMFKMLIDYTNSYEKYYAQSYHASETYRRVPNLGAMVNFNWEMGLPAPNRNHNYHIRVSPWSAPEFSRRWQAIIDAERGRFVAYPVAGQATKPSIIGAGYDQTPHTATDLVFVNAVPVNEWVVDGQAVSTASSYTPTRAQATASSKLQRRQTVTDVNGVITVYISDPITIQKLVKTVQILAGATSFKIPADFNPANPYSVELLGAGGDGLVSNGSYNRGGGGGGGYAMEDRSAVLSIAANDTVAVQIGLGGSELDTFFKSATIAKAAAGKNGRDDGGSSVAASGGIDNIGRTTYVGGNGGFTNANYSWPSGGGGAAGPFGKGGNGNNGSTSRSGGGGGAETGTNIVAVNYEGENNRFGTGKGSFGSFYNGPPGDGTNGGGGGGLWDNKTDNYLVKLGGNGSMELFATWTDFVTGAVAGPGSGGGGSGTGIVPTGSIVSKDVSSAGKFGGGGGGVGVATAASVSSGRVAKGGSGLIIFRYQP